MCSKRFILNCSGCFGPQRVWRGLQPNTSVWRVWVCSPWHCGAVWVEVRGRTEWGPVSHEDRAKKVSNLRYSNCTYASSRKMFIWFLLTACFTTLFNSSDAFTTGQATSIPPTLLIITSPDVYISKSWSMLILSNESGRFTVVPL